jgi:hypothetical protein
MFNLPGESEDDHIQGAQLYRQLRRLGRVKVHYLVYYPTSDILDQAIRDGSLPEDAAERLADGQESDFYDQTSRDADARKTVAGYSALYKILPLLPNWLSRWFTKRQRARHLRWIPSPLIATLQAVNAVRCGDLRFVAYVKGYPAKVLRTMQRATPKPRRKPRLEA